MPTVSTLKNALFNYGPIVVRMVVWDDLDYYRGGVYSHAWTNHTPGGHIVLLVGYDDSQRIEAEASRQRHTVCAASHSVSRMNQPSGAGRPDFAD